MRIRELAETVNHKFGWMSYARVFYWSEVAVYSAADEKQAKSLWKRYAVALSLILAIIVSTHLIESQALKSAQADAELINLSGKQRMLSQQILLYSKLSMSDPDADWGQRVEARAEQFQKAHTRLVNEAWDDPILETLYFHGAPSLNTQVDTFLSAVRGIQRGQRVERHYDDMLALGTGSLLAALDEAVTGFETVANTRAQSMHKLQQITLFAGILIVALVALLIFGPAQGVVNKALKSLRTEIDNHVLSNQRLSNFIDIASDLYWETDLEGRVEYIEGRFLQRMKGTRADLVGCNYADLITMDEAQAEAMRTALRNLSNYHDIRATFVDKDGGHFTLSLSGKARYNSYGELLGYLGKAEDITLEVQAENAPQNLAIIDPLTNVSNRRGFDKELNVALQTATALSPVSLLAIDLYRLKRINDVHGHGAGDFVLKTVASRIQSTLRSDDRVARTAGDIFCVICTDSNSDMASTLVAPRILEAMKQPIQLPSGEYVAMEISIGIAEAPLHAPNASELKDAAGLALQEAKRAGRGCIRVKDMPAHAMNDAGEAVA